MKTKELDLLMQQYFIAWLFCGDNTKAKLKCCMDLNTKLKELGY